MKSVGTASIHGKASCALERSVLSIPTESVLPAPVSRAFNITIVVSAQVIALVTFRGRIGRILVIGNSTSGLCTFQKKGAS